MNLKSRRVVDIHAELIAGYLSVFPDARIKGFEASMRAWCRRHRETLTTNLETWSLEPIGFRPDAHIVDYEAECVVLVEAENTSRIMPRKWEALVDFAWLVDGAEWAAAIHIVDRSRVIRAVSLLEVAVSRLAPEMPKSIAYQERLLAGDVGAVIWTPHDGFLGAVEVAP